jgi:hypothetical protein
MRSLKQEITSVHRTRQQEMIMEIAGLLLLTTGFSGILGFLAAAWFARSDELALYRAAIAPKRHVRGSHPF